MTNSPYNPDEPFTAFDFETTGLDPAKDRIRSIGAVRGTIKDGITHTLELIVDPEGVRSDLKALHVHKIPEDMPGIPQIDAWNQLATFARGSTTIVQNATFESNFITALVKRLGLQTPPEFLLPNIIDTMIAIGSKFPGRALNLDSLCKLSGFTPEQLAPRKKLHNALHDSTLTFELFRLHQLPSSTLDLTITPQSPEPAQNADDTAVSIKAEDEVPDWI